MFFEKFPNIFYTFEGSRGDTVTRIVKDITVNTAVREQFLSNITSYDIYNVEDGETPELLAYKLYGNPQYHWTIMLCNNIRDYRTEWAMSTQSLSRYINDKYNLYSNVRWRRNIDKIIVTLDQFTDLLSIDDEVEIQSVPSIITSGVITDITIGAVDGMELEILPDSMPPSGVSLSFRTFLKEQQVKHYEDANGFIVDPSLVAGAIPVTFYEYEERENDKKRQIKVISPSLVVGLISQFEEIIT